MPHLMQGSGMGAAWPLVHPPGYVDPWSGLQWSRDIHKNAEDRAKLLLLCERDKQARRDVLTVCAKSFPFWADMFVYTVLDRVWDARGVMRLVTGAEKHAPWICWPCHDVLHQGIRDAIEGKKDRTVVVPKSRELRASWHVLLENMWRWLFENNFRSVMVSYDEKSVDSGDYDSLFPRMRYVLEWLPHWMKPPPDQVRDIDMALVNQQRQNSITGRACTENASVGGRPQILFIDEAARHKFLAPLISATSDSASCRVVVSTPLGAGPFKDLCEHPSHQIVPLGYWVHPQKGVGRQWSTDTTGEYTLVKGKAFWWSPFYERLVKVERRDMRSDLIPNQLIGFEGSKGGVFDSGTLINMASNAKHFPPVYQGDVGWDWRGGRHSEADRDERIAKGSCKQLLFTQIAGGKLKLWCSLESGRPRQDTDYVIGADVSNGMASSNSAAVIFDADTGVQVGTWVDPGVDPSMFARVLAELALWFGGRRKQAFVGWERNGPGEQVTKHITGLGLKRLLRGKDALGWWNDGNTKTQLAQSLNTALVQGKCLLYDTALIKEAGDFVYTGNSVEPVHLAADGAARRTHGDRVVAAMVAWMMVENAQRNMPDPELRKGGAYIADEMGLSKPQEVGYGSGFLGS